MRPSCSSWVRAFLTPAVSQWIASHLSAQGGESQGAWVDLRVSSLTQPHSSVTPQKPARCSVGSDQTRPPRPTPGHDIQDPGRRGLGSVPHPWPPHSHVKIHLCLPIFLPPQTRACPPGALQVFAISLGSPRPQRGWRKCQERQGISSPPGHWVTKAATLPSISS